MRPIVTLSATIAATVGVALLTSTALAQQTGAVVEVPSQMEIQSSTIIPDSTEVPEIPPGTQEVDVDTASDAVETPRVGDSGPAVQADPEAAEQATEAVEEMVEDGEVVDAEPTESWLSCSSDSGELPGDCEPDAQTEIDQPIPSEDGIGDTTATLNGGEATTVREPLPGNDAVDNLTTGGGAAPRPANEPAVMSMPAVVDTTAPERPQELENEPQEVLTREGGEIDLEKDARVVPETATAVTQ